MVEKWLYRGKPWLCRNMLTMIGPLYRGRFYRETPMLVNRQVTGSL